MALDHPFEQTVANAMLEVQRGNIVFQKFTCWKCQTRLTMDVPNQFFTEGTCDACGYVTDIKENGCNFLLIASGDENTGELLRRLTKGLASE